MGAVHGAIGFAVLALFTVGWGWGAVAAVRRRTPGERFWTWLTVTQIAAGVQALYGMLLLSIGREVDTWLHVVYGLGPVAILGVAHLLAREENFRERPWVPFALASFICFGLSLRAAMTGLGIG